MIIDSAGAQIALVQSVNFAFSGTPVTIAGAAPEHAHLYVQSAEASPSRALIATAISDGMYSATFEFNGPFYVVMTSDSHAPAVHGPIRG